MSERDGYLEDAFADMKNGLANHATETSDAGPPRVRFSPDAWVRARKLAEGFLSGLVHGAISCTERRRGESVSPEDVADALHAATGTRLYTGDTSRLPANYKSTREEMENETRSMIEDGNLLTREAMGYLSSTPTTSEEEDDGEDDAEETGDAHRCVCGTELPSHRQVCPWCPVGGF